MKSTLLLSLILNGDMSKPFISNQCLINVIIIYVLTINNYGCNPNDVIEINKGCVIVNIIKVTLYQYCNNNHVINNNMR